ncbi:hypothetical protein [Spirosoma validum]|uniref:T9SS type A sorting domain-containing protein n=1 Tax=Spirosoma validum TaxID=2771355 RepID=A0A927B6G4_9BACT|nr:hypothetical protein [Spirosoma validum]MBD2756589.1 hypothetical protein [Spirosoma validum]
MGQISFNGSATGNTQAATYSGFTTTASFTISQPSTHTNVSTLGASTGTASVTLTDGISADNYDRTSDKPIGDGTSNITRLSTGIYSIKITDANGCTVISSTTVGSDSSALRSTFAGIWCFPFSIWWT